MRLRAMTSSLAARTRIKVSSAYCKTGQGASIRGWWMEGQSLIMRWSTSATRMKRYGDRASPCRRPRIQAIQGPGQPLTRTAERNVARIWDIQLIHRGGKPLDCRMRSRLSQLTESNALAKSSLTTSVGCLRRWQH
ncbi:hypothetical protein PVAP13_7NG355348 [Panicum virgatum]|uniref:Uncharacterized protein n=1 Tax=Panicum virgatum TaxID=38727 RepID=A0A8T0PXX7_PANVG|nr:hypothetical protein PVAP13_7NG355348 [Panicum virgatum]